MALDLANWCEPLRLAVVDKNGFPRIVSLWFHFENDHYYCVTHRNAWVVKQLQLNPQVGFEISSNRPPYRGIRGNALASLEVLEGDLFERIIARFLGDSNAALSEWLLSRKDEELVIRLTPQLQNEWDYSQRMQALD